MILWVYYIENPIDNNRRFVLLNRNISMTEEAEELIDSASGGEKTISCFLTQGYLVQVVTISCCVNINATNYFVYLIWLLYMTFDRFLLAVESRDLSQADKSII